MSNRTVYKLSVYLQMPELAINRPSSLLCKLAKR